MSISVEVKGLDKLEASFGKLSSQFSRILRKIAIAVGQEVRREARWYPKRNHAAASAAFSFVSDKQRRGFFWHLNQGNIQVPYKRTDILKNGWHVTSQGTKAIVENPIPYAPFAHSPEEQTAVLDAIGWPTTPEIAEKFEQSGKGDRVASHQIEQELSKLGL